MWPAAIAAVVVIVVIAGVATYLAQRSTRPFAHDGNGTGSIAPAAEPAGPEPAGTNEAAARAEVTRLLGGLRLPDGTKPVTTAPSPRLKGDLGSWNVQSPKPWLRRWYVTSRTSAQTLAWLRVHPEQGLTMSGYEEDGQLVWQGTATSAYTQPFVVETVVPLPSGGSGLRTEVQFAARFDRTAATMAPAGATSAVITKSAIDGDPRPPDQHATVTDPGTLATLTAAYDAIPGAPDHAATPSGSPVGMAYVYSVTFRSTDHTLVVGDDNPWDAIGHSVALDGRTLPQQVDSSNALDDVLDRAMTERLPAPVAPTTPSAPSAPSNAV